MVCFNFYVFDRNGICLYYNEWHRTKSVKQGAGSKRDEEKQLFGLIWTLKNLTAAVNPKESHCSTNQTLSVVCRSEKPRLGALMKIGEGCSYRSFRTNVYQCHFLESPSGLKFVLNTSPDQDSGAMHEVLKAIYSQVYVECVAKNPLYVPNSKFDSDTVTEQLNTFMKKRALIP